LEAKFLSTIINSAFLLAFKETVF